LKKISLLLIFVLLTGCSYLNQQAMRKIKNIRILRSIDTSYVPHDCCYSAVHNTVFVMQEGSNIVHIYSSTGEKNMIGGLGFGKNKFSKLSDITISPDANLLILDSFEKSIKKFDWEGSLIAEIQLKEFGRPVLFDVSNDGTYFIYDEQKNEIISTSDFKNFYNFGKFQLSEPYSLNLQRTSLQVYEREADKTLLFSILGQFEREYEGNVQMKNQQVLKLEKYYLTTSKGERKFAINPQGWQHFIWKDNYVYLLAKNKVIIAELEYE
jgi:hypothetical protein